MARSRTESEQIVKIDQVAKMLADGASIGAIAKESKMSPATVRAIADTKECKQLVEDFVTRRRERIFRSMEVLSLKAVSTHMEIMDDAKHRERLAAAESILDRAGFGRTQKIEKNVVKTVIQDDFDGRTSEELEFYAANGYFKEDG